MKWILCALAAAAAAVPTKRRRLGFKFGFSMFYCVFIRSTVSEYVTTSFR